MLVLFIIKLSHDGAQRPEGAQHPVRFSQIRYSPAERCHSQLHLLHKHQIYIRNIHPSVLNNCWVIVWPCSWPAQSQQPVSSCHLRPADAGGCCGGRTARWPSERFSLCSQRQSPCTGSDGSNQTSLWRWSPAAPSCTESMGHQAYWGWKQACNTRVHVSSAVTKFYRQGNL